MSEPDYRPIMESPNMQGIMAVMEAFPQSRREEVEDALRAILDNRVPHPSCASVREFLATRTGETIGLVEAGGPGDVTLLGDLWRGFGLAPSDAILDACNRDDLLLAMGIEVRMQEA